MEDDSAGGGDLAEYTDCAAQPTRRGIVQAPKICGIRFKLYAMTFDQAR
jgi:hypothetical protein